MLQAVPVLSNGVFQPARKPWIVLYFLMGLKQYVWISFACLQKIKKNRHRQSIDFFCSATLPRMPAFSQSRNSSRSFQPPQQGPAPSGPRSMLGNSAMVDRLLGAGNKLKGALSSVKENFPDLEDGGGASTELLAGAAELGENTTADTTGGDTTQDAGANLIAKAGDEQQTGSQTTGTQTNTKVTPKEGTLAASVYDKHSKQVGNMSSKLSAAQLEDLELFAANWKKNKGRYEAVAAKTGIPAPLIAAIHWRESTGNFNTYLHQGDPLGKPAVHVPKDIPVFDKWEDAAVHALTMSDKKKVRDDLGMTANTRDSAAMATYAEFYNGLGYNNKNTASPYVYSGTDQYSEGKYVSDGRYSKNTVDQQLGVMTMVGAIDGMDQKINKAPVVGLTGWESVKAGRPLKRGAKGPGQRASGAAGQGRL
jgi:lysozyme family protein